MNIAKYYYINDLNSIWDVETAQYINDNDENYMQFLLDGNAAINLSTEEQLIESLSIYDLPRGKYLESKNINIMLTKREFLRLVIGLTKHLPTPITLTDIENYVAQASEDIRIEWTYANHIERNHPMLDEVSKSFGISSDMLDTMFLNSQALLYKIDNDLPLHE